MRPGNPAHPDSDPSQAGEGIESAFLLPPYRILDLTDETGMFAGKLLADLGADVIKVEPPGGDPTRGRPPFFRGRQTTESSLDFLAFNTNKRSVTLDITHPKGRDCLLALARGADAVIESFSPGYLDEIHAGYPVLSASNPRLVMASITPYGQTGPRRNHLSCDMIAMATSGFMQITGDPDGPPIRLGNEQSRFPAGLYAALGVTAALMHRDWHAAPGQHIDVSIQETLLSFYLEQHPVLFWNMRRKNVIRVGPLSNLSVPAGVFPCQDGWVGIGIFTSREWEALSHWLAEVTGREEVLAEELRGGIHARAAHRDLIEAVVLDFTLRQPRARLFTEGQRRNLVVVPVNTVADIIADDALAEANFWKELEHPIAGKLRYPLHILGPEVPAAGRAAPLLGEANEAIFCGELGWSRARLRELEAEGVIGPTIPPDPSPPPADAPPPQNDPSPYVATRRHNTVKPPAAGRSAGGGESRPVAASLLEGITVVEFGPFIALPLTGRILAALGATVIKVETNKQHDQLAFVPPWGKGMGQPEYQALKKRVTLDVRTAEGARIFDRLLEVSDVLITNFRRDALARWGVDLDGIRARHPSLVLLHQGGFGAGPYESYKLYGIMAQHLCGVSMMTGAPGAPPCCLNSAYSDYHTPLFQALAVLGALDRRRRSRCGMFIEGSIFRSGVSTVATALLDWQASGRLPNRLENHDAVAVPHGVYACRGEDEWCAVAVWDDAQWKALCQVLEHAEWSRDPSFATPAARRERQAAIDSMLTTATRGWDKHELMEALQTAGVPAGIVAKGRDLASDPQLESRHLYAKTTYYVTDANRPGIEWKRGPDVLAARLPILFSDTPCRIGPYHRIGEDNSYVFRELLRMPADEIRDLTERGVFL